MVRTETESPNSQLRCQEIELNIQIYTYMPKVLEKLGKRDLTIPYRINLVIDAPSKGVFSASINMRG